MSYLKEFRTEATERLELYREAKDEQAALKDILNWLAEKMLQSYRNGQESKAGKAGQKR